MNAMSIFDISGRAMSAQMVRLNSTASNLANVGTGGRIGGGRFPSNKARVPISDESRRNIHIGH